MYNILVKGLVAFLDRGIPFSVIKKKRNMMMLRKWLKKRRVAALSRRIEEIKYVPREPPLETLFKKFISEEEGIRTTLQNYSGQVEILGPFYEIPKINGRPNLLLFGLDESCKRFEVLLEDAGDANLLALIGPTGCGKTRYLFERLATTYGVYFDATGPEINDVIEHTYSKAETELTCSMYKMAMKYTRAALWVRLRVLKYCLEENKVFDPYIWLMLQTRVPEVFRSLLKRALAECDDNREYSFEIRSVLSSLPEKVFDSLVTCLDEAHLLLKTSSTTLDEAGPSIYTPIVQALLSPSDCDLFDRKVIVSGTSPALGVHPKVGIHTKPPEIFVMEDFDGWESPKQVKEYADKLALHLTLQECKVLFRSLRGRYMHIVTCLESVLLGKSVVEAVNDYQDSMMKASNMRGLYWWLRNATDDGKDCAKLKHIVYQFAYFGTTTQQDPWVIEHGIGRFSGGSVRVNEPMVVAGIRIFLENTTGIKLRGLKGINWEDPIGQLWNKFLYQDFSNLFNGKDPINKHPLFRDLYLSKVFLQEGKLISESLGPDIAHGSEDYKMLDYLKEPAATRAAMFICEKDAGPHLCFWVRMQDGTELPCFVRFGLLESCICKEGKEGTTNAEDFYKFEDARIPVKEACVNGYFRFKILVKPCSSKTAWYCRPIRRPSSVSPESPEAVVCWSNRKDFLSTKHRSFIKLLEMELE